MNFTADLVSQELYKLKTIQDSVIRTYSSAREDIFNIKIKDLPEYSILYKMLFKTELLDEYTKEKTEMHTNEICGMNDDKLL